ncbi:hypothetical protein PI124_g18846 [Phytophthora idaei]|nr:hypothetical protein PI124_g18846 [Phytophthora idaei]
MDNDSISKASFELCSSIAREIICCRRVTPATYVTLMAVEIAIAYRNVCTSSECVYMFAEQIPEVNVIAIDLSAAFGWTVSSGTHGILGGTVAFHYGSLTNVSQPSGFYKYHWVDDHVNVTSDDGANYAEVDRSLRWAMAADMCPDAIAKTKRLVACAFHASGISRSDYRALLGSLRHVATASARRVALSSVFAKTSAAYSTPDVSRSPRPSTGPHGLEGRQQARAPPRQKEPVFIATRSLSTSLDRQDPADQALWGEGSDFFFVLRRYEIVATTATTFWWFALKAADVTIIDAAGSPTLDPSHPEAVCIRLEGSEASQSEPPVVRMLSRSGHRSRARCLEHCFSCAPEETCRRRAQCCIHEQAWRTILCHCDPKCTGDPRHRTGMGDDPRLQHALV